MTIAHANDVPLIDHHCHGVVLRDLDEREFAHLGAESEWESLPGLDPFDAPFGLALRTICAPALGLERHAPVSAYLERRRELGWREASRILLAGAGLDATLIETGFPRADLATPADMAELSGRPAGTIVRLESIAQQVACGDAAGFAARFEAELDRQLEGALGVKTVAAYRVGLDLPAEEPSAGELEAAVAAWLAASGEEPRLADRTIIGWIVWQAIRRRQVIQVHVGFGDGDVQLDRADPSLLTPMLRASRESGARFALLHCYPYLRQAASIANVFPHAWLDASCLSHYAGPSAGTMLRHALEIAPFGKLLYASDAYGLPEQYLVSAVIWRRSIGRLLGEWVEDGWLPAAEAEGLVEGFARGNASRLYGLAGLVDDAKEARR